VHTKEDTLGSAWKIGRVAGIPVRVHWTLPVLLVAFAVLTGAGVLGIVASAVLLFGSVVAHELAHALVARGYGIRTRDIVLTPLGGVARLEGMASTGRAEVAIALAGPAASLALAGLSWLVIALVSPSGILGSALDTLLWANAMLGLFNLLPAFPMDGGRVLRGLLHDRIGIERATRIAAAIGRGAAIVMALVGIFTQTWSLLVIAVFVWIAGGRERDAVVTEQNLMRARRHAWAPVPRAWDEHGRRIPIELVDDRPAQAVPRRMVILRWPPGPS
jgi:Zn-dependent protease